MRRETFKWIFVKLMSNDYRALVTLHELDKLKKKNR